MQDLTNAEAELGRPLTEDEAVQVAQNLMEEYDIYQEFVPYNAPR